MFSFLPLINSLLLLSIWMIISSKIISSIIVLSFLFGLYSFKSLLFRFLINIRRFFSNESLAYKWILSISCYWLIKLNNKFVFPDHQPPIINILYGWSGICGYFGLYCLLFSFVISSKLIIFCIFYLNVALNFFFLIY